ncbi:Purine catabolism protein PucG [Mannheimia haemolytica]|uniref:Purine catabolism protein PucG n=1 Tax=Mannheimia haemolytica TaxID=75985 RepID=A0A378N9N1_MANHA|nr:Purine catabolism protein PucG [Mannheimia haemolytica]
MMQPLEEIGKICKQYDAMLIVDTVATLGGVDIRVDEWGIDACIGGTQKCISAPSAQL